jgi:hypothetical protein
MIIRPVSNDGAEFIPGRFVRGRKTQLIQSVAGIHRNDKVAR